MLLIYLTCWLVLGFLCGSIPFGWVVARAHGIDLKGIGSGSIGATNVRRALGWGWAIVVLVLDVLKGLLPLLALKICLSNMPDTQIPLAWHPWLLQLTGIAAILGHTFTPWLKFRGGKGIATGLGVVIALMGWWIAAPLGCFLLVTATTRMVSVGSMFAALLTGALIVSIPELRPFWLLGVGVPVLIFWTHRENIERIIAGTESRVFEKKLPVDESESAESEQSSSDD